LGGLQAMYACDANGVYWPSEVVPVQHKIFVDFLL
jgi:hypothetical protein